MVQRLVVIGGDAAGMSAASQARKRRGPDELAIVAFERGRYTSYSACGIPYWISGTVDDLSDLVSRSPEEHRRNGIDVRTRTEVVGIDLDGRTVRARDLDAGREYDEPFDDLVYAAGSVPTRPPVPGIDAPGVYGVQTLDDGAAVRAALDGGARQVVIIGGGYIGLEVAEACQVRGLDVTVVDLAATPVGTFDPDVGRYIADAVRKIGVNLVLSDGVAEIETGDDGAAVAVHTKSGRRLPADVVVLGLGVRPNVALAREAGIPLGPSGGIAVDHRMRTQAEGVWAAGDCVESIHRLSGQRVVVALGTHANKQGRVAGINLGGGYATFPGVIGTAITKLCDLEVARTGLSEREAEEAGLPLRHRGGRLDDAGRLLPRRSPDPAQADRRAADGPAARRADRGPRGRGEADRRAGDGDLERDGRRRDPVAGPVVRPAVLARLGPGADRGPQGVRRGRGRPPRPRRSTRLIVQPPRPRTINPADRAGDTAPRAGDIPAGRSAQTRAS